MPKRTGKYYLKFTIICLLIMVTIAFVIPGIILFGYKISDRIKGRDSGQNDAEKRIKAREAARNQGVLLDETPEELLARLGVIYHDGDSLAEYYAVAPIKVKSDENEFKQFCVRYFGTESALKFSYWEGECFSVEYGDYMIRRTELFNPKEYGGKVYYVEDVGMEGMTCSYQFFYDATGKYALVKHGDNNEAIAKFIGLTLDGKDDDYNPFANQKYERELKLLEELRSVGVLLSSAPEELSRRTEDIFDGVIENLYSYYGASEAIKVSSDSEEFENFCREFFFDHPEPVTFHRMANETISAVCGEYEIYRTEIFNPEKKEAGHLYYVIDGLDDGMSLTTEFVYDPTGKYAMIWYDLSDNAKYVLAKFIGLKFTEENPYVSLIQAELDKLSSRHHGVFGGDIWKYAAYNSVVRVESSEDEFMQYCDEFFKDCDEKITYWPGRDATAVIAECGDYIILRTQFFDPIRYGEKLFYEDDSLGDTAPIRRKFFYDATGKYALVYMCDDSENELCIKFLGF